MRGGIDYTTRVSYTTQITKYLEMFSLQDLISVDIDSIIYSLHPDSSKRMIYIYRKAILKFREYVLSPGVVAAPTYTATVIKGE
ncbi:MAG: hypothetical protein PHF13_06190 [Acholeplasmataceae bacterium]|nr:hypothetical protein [Acholeplasmataceae bacterium]